MKKRLTTKSREAGCDLFRGSASSPYNKIGTHLDFVHVTPKIKRIEQFSFISVFALFLI